MQTGSIISDRLRAVGNVADSDDRFATLVSPYARYNLRRNPFGELTREERAELAVVDVQRWLDVLREPSIAIQFMGQKGEGKTTHLLALERCLPEASYIYLPEDEPPPAITTQRPLLIDEAQRLRPGHRRRIFRQGGPLVLGTHEDLSKELQRAGLTAITVNVASDHSPARLAQILNARIEASRIADMPVPRIEIPFACHLQSNLGDSIRAIEQLLYDDFQQAAQQGLPWPIAT